MIRTYMIPCDLPKEQADALNLNSGRIYSGIVSRHWRLLKQKGLWLKEKSLTKLSDLRLENKAFPMHAHSIDAAQQGFFKACQTTRALRKIGIEANFPWRSKKFRTTIWKSTAIKFKGGRLEMSTGAGNPKIVIDLPDYLWSALRFVEVRLVYDKKARKYNWHIVVENGKQAKPAPGNNGVSVDMGEIHPAVVGDENEATIITCREWRHEAQGHAKRLASFRKALSRKKKGSRRYRKLVRSKNRMKAKHKRIIRDIEHKVSREMVNVAVECKADTIAMGDVRDLADGIDIGKKSNQQISGWSHGQIRKLTEYKAEAEGIKVELVDEAYTSQTCPNCGGKHKPRGRNYRCPSCGFRSHRDVVGQVNILSTFKHGAPGQIPAPTTVKHRMPHNLRLMRSCGDTRLIDPTGQSVAREVASREAAGF
ncbi:MAG: transposase [Caldilineaceae bacterium]